MPILRLGRILLFLLISEILLTSSQSFLTPILWHPFFCVSDEICSVGDFNGDGKDDIIDFIHNEKFGPHRGNVWVGISTDEQFSDAQLWSPRFCVGNQDCGIGDFNGDGRDDILYFDFNETNSTTYGSVWVALSTSTGFSQAKMWSDFFCANRDICIVGDYNGDGKDDIINFVYTNIDNHVSGTTLVAISNGVEFISSQIGYTDPCLLGNDCKLGDVDGDGRSDLIQFINASGAYSGAVWVSLATSDGFDAPQVWYTEFCDYAQATCSVGDFNNDGRSDLIRFLRNSQEVSGDTRITPGQVDIAYSLGTGFGSIVTMIQSFCINDEICKVADVNGDGFDDLVAFSRGEEGSPYQGNVWVSMLVAQPFVESELFVIPTATEASNSCAPRPVDWEPYTVRAGDTLFRLATPRGTTVQRVQEVNCIGDSTNLRIGQQLFLPVQVVVAPPNPLLDNSETLADDNCSCPEGDTGCTEPSYLVDPCTILSPENSERLEDDETFQPDDACTRGDIGCDRIGAFIGTATPNYIPSEGNSLPNGICISGDVSCITLDTLPNICPGCPNP